MRNHKNTAELKNQIEKSSSQLSGMVSSYTHFQTLHTCSIIKFESPYFHPEQLYRKSTSRQHQSFPIETSSSFVTSASPQLPSIIQTILHKGHQIRILATIHTPPETSCPTTFIFPLVHDLSHCRDHLTG